jgi:hypothetical protein
MKLKTCQSGAKKYTAVVVILQSQYYTSICINHVMDLVILQPNYTLNKAIRKTWNTKDYVEIKFILGS